MDNRSPARNRTAYISFFIFVLLCVQSAYSQDFGSGYYRLTNKWLGDGKALDVVNDGSNDKLKMADANDSTGQEWKLTPVGDGYYRLTTKWLGAEKSLNVVNDESDTNLNLAHSGNVTGQYWKITPVGGGFYRLTTKWLGEEHSLDVVNDSQKNKLQLAETSSVTGQLWKILDVSPVPTISKGWEGEKRKQLSISGFKIIIGTNFAERPESKEALSLLEQNLETITRLVKPEHLANLRKIPIWVQYKYVPDGALWYLTSKEWLVENGYPVEMEKSVEISNMGNFLAEKDHQPLQVLHELAHAFQDLFIPDLQDELQAAYDNAVASGKYDSVERNGNGNERAYAMKDITEYFAELTEAYFGKNDYYPYDREQLKAVDPKGFQLMQHAWE